MGVSSNTGGLTEGISSLDGVTITNSPISGSTGSFTTVSANTAIVSTVSAASVYATNTFQPVAIISAAGSAQATAAVLTAVINRGKGVTDGEATGFAIPANRTGGVQYIINDVASANLWPPTGGTINGLAANAAFAMAANIPYVIIPITASAYAVK